MKITFKKIVAAAFLVLLCVVPARDSAAELVERVVAVVNDNVILLSELRAAIERAEDGGKDATPLKIINDIINEQLLLEQAAKYSHRRLHDGTEPAEPEEVIREYINKRIKALIYIPFRDVEAYYYSNIKKYGDRDFYDVKREIEVYLLEKELEVKLRQHIETLRRDARIRIQLDE